MRSSASGPGFVRRAVRVLRTRWDILLVVAAGGVLGSLARWAVGLALPHSGRDLPWSTFAVNAVGCLLIGVLMWFEEERWAPSRYRRSFLRTGVLGGLTTFSAFGLDAHTLVGAGAAARAALYVLASLAVGLAAVPVGAAAAAGGVRLAGLARHRRPEEEP